MNILSDLINGLQPKEIARPCPNCGRLYWDSELNNSSNIKTSWGGSVLYGVCKTCKNIHDMQDENYTYSFKNFKL
jgi:hypothetical protein